MIQNRKKNLKVMHSIKFHAFDVIPTNRHDACLNLIQPVIISQNACKLKTVHAEIS